eukprot:192543_1
MATRGFLRLRIIAILTSIYLDIETDFYYRQLTTTDMSGASSISPDSSTNVLLLKKAIYLLQQGNGYRPCHLPPSDVIFIIQRNKHQSIPFQIIDLLLYLRIFRMSHPTQFMFC